VNLKGSRRGDFGQFRVGSRGGKLGQKIPVIVPSTLVAAGPIAGAGVDEVFLPLVTYSESKLALAEHRFKTGAGEVKKKWNRTQSVS